ncbi:MAG: valine--tRNA ligase [Chloroflexi bacterium]|nr:valine--tRNA ligase [Chloroflexota bacterium]
MADLGNRAAPLPKAYDPSTVEGKWYAFWEGRDYFTPQIVPGKNPFVIIMPPPNVTGELHLGHALTAALEDALIRWHRMRGEPALWLPGVDHAGIAGQNVVEKLLASEGLTRHQLGRERFLERMWQWMDKYRGIISEQHRRLGVSCDWTRERFTMDDGPSRAVRTTFVNLYNKGLIYRGERLINWCPRCATALSDLEVEHQDTSGHLWYVSYPLEGGGTIQVATTRPETILGDTAVAVNPSDDRYQSLVGRRAILPVLGRRIPIIADEAVDPAFGTGAVKITPAHDPVDFEVAGRHHLPAINIMNEDATMNAEAGPYAGLDRYECRRRLLADLERDSLLVKTEPHSHAIGHCQRCRTVVEPRLSLQWFVRIQPLAEPAIRAVTEGRIKIVPERFTKVYLNWMEGIHDWCISRQLWWGHRIPAWHCRPCSQITVAVEPPSACAHCGSADIQQDPDVLDTWFSSGLWPHSTLGWPDKTPDLGYFYPTSVMETGYDILFFWVARMIMMGLENTDDVPFRTIYLHGLVRDEKGEKMSKSRGNVLDPLVAAEKYGTDALRLSLSMGTAPGNDMRLSQTKLEAGRNFANKLWNAGRFVLSNLQGLPPQPLPKEVSHPQDRWILSRLGRLVAGVNRLLEDFQLGEAERQIHDFLWGEYCDWYIELAKLRIKEGSTPSPLPVLVHVLDTSLRLLHPFMPFITEELWQALRPYLQEPPEALIIAPYPSEAGEPDPQAEAEVEAVIEIIVAIRNARAEAKVEPSRWVEAAASTQILTLEGYLPAISALARANTTLVRPEELPKMEAKVLVLSRAVVALPWSGMIDLEAERSRLAQELESWQQRASQQEARLQDQAFLAKAPPEVVEQQRQRLEEARERLARLEARLRELGAGAI